MTKKGRISLVKCLLYFSPFLFPLYLIRFQPFGVPLTLIEIYTYLVFGFWCLGVIFGAQKIVWNRRIKLHLIAIFLLFLGASLGAFFAPDILPSPGGDIPGQRVAWGIWKGWIVAPMLYFWVLIQSVKTSTQIDRLLRYFVYGATLLMLASYGLGVWGDGFSHDLRLQGPFVNPNFLALYAVPAFLLATHFLFSVKASSKWQIRLDAFAWATLGHGLFLTKSYGAFLGVFGALVLYALTLLIKKPTWRKKIGVGLSILLILFIGLLITQWNSPKFQQALDFEGRSSSSVRLEIYRTSIDLIKQNPILGIGPGLFQPNYQNQAPESLGKLPTEWNMPHSHNIFLEFWLNAGLLGLLSLLSLLVLAHQRFTYPLVAFWGMLIHGLFDVPFWKNDLAMVFWLVVGSILILQQTVRHSDRSSLER